MHSQMSLRSTLVVAALITAAATAYLFQATYAELTGIDAVVMPAHYRSQAAGSLEAQ